MHDARITCGLNRVNQYMLTPYTLSEIRVKLERYHTMHCGLKHERVVEFSSFDGADSFKRYGLCDSPTRRYKLGCAHTLANQEFCRLILSVGAQFPGARALAEEFDQLFLYVYIIDVAKGALEKQLALALSVNNNQFIVEAKAAIAQVVATHHQLIKTIEELRLRFMAALLP